jgi:hypothetical protein
VGARTIFSMHRTKRRVVVCNSARTKMLSGSYTVENDIITVTSQHGTKSAETAGLTAMILAKIILRELGDGAKTQNPRAGRV